MTIVTGRTTVTPPSGRQYSIHIGQQRATIVGVGGGIREYEVAGRPVLDPYPSGSMADGAHGTPLVPWPNRLRDGRYRFDGTAHQLPLTEPEKGNAIHGLLRWRAWRPVEVSGHRVVMGIRLHPMPGYPFMLDVRVEYRLGEHGLQVSTTATNMGDIACPYGCGQHPYLSPGMGLIDECTLHLDATTRITTDQRGLPVGREPVVGTPLDFRSGVALGALQVDSALTDLARDGNGRAWARLAASDGHTAELWVDRHYPYIEIFTGDTLAPGRRRRGLGCEPMTCPPDAFTSGIDLIRLEPGKSITTTWGARLRSRKS
ncbi:MAG: aldose 1-epimerase family protein [Actinomycetota bacterium]|nr:aldose 1-epimerase family protein [Actinomycetota bacterium]